MKFAYKFSNLLGTVYRKGNLLFTPDGNSIISPVGNRVSIFDLKNNKSETLPVESQLNITSLALSPDGSLLIAVNEEGEALLISLKSRSLLHSYKFHRPVNAISFSPDGRKFAVTKESKIHVFHAPGKTKEFNPFQPYRTFFGAFDDTVSIDWSSDSRAFCVGCKDMNTRVYGAERFENLIIYSLGGHTDCVLAAFFEHESLDLYTLSQNGQLCVWDCDTDLDGLVPWRPPEERTDAKDAETESASETDEEEEGTESEKKAKEKQEKAESEIKEKILYKRLAKHNFKDARGEGAPAARLTAATYHKITHILVTGFQDGVFFLHEMPDFNLIHSLSVSDQSVMSLAFNSTGEWLALGCAGLGQLLVWEWQSESYVLKQQGHFSNMSCLAYSPDGQNIVTGGDDGKVKVWNTMSGFCFVTFNEHLAGVTGVVFNQNGQVVLSASLDGTVRAFDLNRYRNFRTFTSPHPVQFASLALDHSGEIVCAGGLDTFNIFVWSLQTGRLLEVLSGHEGPVSSLAFCGSHAMLASGSWDHTVRLWDIFESKNAKEGIQLTSDALAVTYRPDGAELAVATLDGQITFWDVHTATQNGAIEGRHDLGYSRRDNDKVSAKKVSSGKAFTTLCYTADGQCILAGGRSKNICIYSVADQLLMRKFEVTCNRSFDGTEEFLDRRKMTEFGSLSLVDEDGEGDGKVSLPGVRAGDMSSRRFKPEVRVAGVRFSPTGRAWSAVTTEGLLVYSLDHSVVFDPFDLEEDLTSASVQHSLQEQEYSTALMLALRLNEQALIQQVIEGIPPKEVDFVSSSLPEVYVDRCLSYVAGQLESTPHLHFYLQWCERLLQWHGPALKLRSHSIMGTLRTLQKNITRKYDDLAKICDHNKYTIQFVLSMAQLKRKRPLVSADGDDVGSDDAMDALSDDGSAEGILDELRNNFDDDSS